MVIKVEPAMTAHMEEALIAKAWAKTSGRGGYRSGGSRGGLPPQPSFGTKTPYRNTTQTQQNNSSNTAKPENPKNAKGEIIKCLSCMSIRHLLDNYPDSYENLHKFKSVMLGTAQPEQETAAEEEKEEGSGLYASAQATEDDDQNWNELEHVSFFTTEPQEMRKGVSNNK